jgi:hypothetical protein
MRTHTQHVIQNFEINVLQDTSAVKKECVLRTEHATNTERGFSFHRGVNEIFALLGCYTAQIGNYPPMYRDNPSVPYSTVKPALQMFRNNLLAPSSRAKQPYRCFATTHRYHIQASSSLTDVSEKPTGPIFNGQAALLFSCPEISVNNY